jgi:uncharacterized protein YbjT (DUF2867 family)
MGRKATLLGASGLIGGILLDFLLQDGYYDEIHILVRKPLQVHHEKLKESVIDFSDPSAYSTAIEGAETVFCAVGTTMKKIKGDRNAYRKVDYDIPVTAAKKAATLGVFDFVYVSSIGANASDNNNFYLKLKGVAEETITKEAIPAIHIFRPSLLLGKRTEKRFGESVAQFLAPILSPLIPSRWNEFKPVKAKEVALAMLAASKLQSRGIFIYKYADIKKLCLTADQYQA